MVKSHRKWFHLKPSFTEKFKSKNAATLSGGGGAVAGATRSCGSATSIDFAPGLHRSEEEYCSPELCFVSVPIKGAKRDMLHVIDDDLAVQYLPAKKIKRHRLALACKPHDVFFFCVVPSQNLDNAWNADALKACHKAQTHWIQAMSRRSESALKATRPSSRRIRTHSPSRNGHRVRWMSCWKSRSRTPTSTTTAIPDCCA